MGMKKQSKGPGKKQAVEYDLEKDLRRCGYATFVRHYEQYADPRCTVGDIKAMLMAKYGYTRNSSATKASAGKRIMGKGAGRAALEIISRAPKIDDKDRQTALKLLSRPK